MPARGDIFAYVREKFGTEPEYPWTRYPHYAVLRHRQGRKWYGLIMDVPGNRLGRGRAGEALPFPPLISTFDPLHGTCGRCSILHSTHSASLST